MLDTIAQQQRLFIYMCSLFTGPITKGVLAFVSYFIDYGGKTDSNAESITRALKLSCSRGWFSKQDKEYRMHVALREGARQHNTKLKLRLRLPMTGQFHDAFVIGA